MLLGVTLNTPHRHFGRERSGYLPLQYQRKLKVVLSDDRGKLAITCSWRRMTV